MTATLDLHPTPGHPGAVVAAVHEALDEVGDVAVPGLAYAEVVRECARARSRLQSLELKLVAEAEKAKVPQLSGDRSTGAWLAKQTRSGQADSARDAQLAQDLDTKLPATADALEVGEVSPAHASVIAHAVRRLPRDLTPAQRAAVEKRLVEKARTLDPRQLRRVARRALEAVERDTAKVDAHEDGELRDEEADALRKTRLTLHDNGDGTTTGHFTVPLLAASMLKKIVDAMTAPRRVSTGSTSAGAGSTSAGAGSTSAGPGSTSAGPGSNTVGRGSTSGDRRDPAHDRGLAFTTLLEHLPTDRLHSKVAATVLVKLDLDTLRGQLKAAGLDTGDLVSAAEARRLACGAGLVPAVLGGASQPLDLGRSKRLFTEAQRVAGALTHTACAADGCEVPYAWAELHHLTPWSREGQSDLRELTPLCGFHHRRIHDSGYLHRRFPDGSIRFTQRT